MPAPSCRMNPARTSSWWLATEASAGVSLRVGTKEREVRMAGTYLIPAAPWKSIGPPYRRPLALPLQLALDRVLELLVRDGTVDEHAVDEERRRPSDARLLAGLPVRLDQRALLATVQALVEPRAVESQLLRVTLQVLDGELLLVREHAVVQLPELVAALVGRAGARLGGLLREGVEVEREVAEDEAHLALVLLHHPLHHRVLAPAIRALEVGELHDREGRVLRPARRPGGGHLDTREVRLGQRDLHAVLRLQVLHHLGELIAALLLLQVRRDAVLDLVVALAAHLRLVLFVELLHLLVARSGNGGEQALVEPLLQRLALRLGLVLEEPLGDVLLHGVATHLVQLGQRLDLGLEQLAALLLLDLAVGDRLPVHNRDLIGGAQRKRALLRLRSRLAGERQDQCRAREQTLALHVALQKGKTRTLGRASSHVNRWRCGRLPPSALSLREPRRSELRGVSRHQRRGRVDVERVGKQESLHESAAEPVQSGRLGGRLHALGHHLHAQVAPEQEDRLDDAAVLLVRAHRPDEARIDLEQVDGQPVQVAERAVPGAEVVDAQLQPELPQAGQAPRRGGGVLDQHALGDLQPQRARVQPGGPQRVVDLLDQVGLQHLPAGDEI